MNKIAVVNSKSFGKFFSDHLKRCQELGGVEILDIDPHLSSKEIASKLKSFAYIIASVTPEFDRIFFENTPNLKLIARHGLGYNNIDVQAATEYGVYVTKVKGIVEQEAVAEQTLALLMAQIRMINQADYSLRNKPWSLRSNYCGIELKNSTVGIIGYGNIGRRVGEIVAKGFGSHIIVYDPYKSSEYIETYYGKKVDLEMLLKTADVICINASANHENVHMLSYEQFKEMKKDVIITNTARGILIDQAALVKNLTCGKVKSYGADVFEKEPIQSDNPLLAFENVILTPHIGAYTYPSLKGMGDKVLDDIEAVQEGKAPQELVNEGVLGR
ncbi:D-isomer specific 2-hydroxyacid dehydrogenase family protein [Enterococcus sp.]|uniref:D-isomer specific 2-hydroxyacid dehydrogenase family protein n=1 Tax=Enterococcus sp. TaxID=35783 RepID=UPI000ECF6595|nr:D-isomer specific 2-hydroxyacid dehydrogenase family protein [Enterococcus sp.]HAB96458.1 hydroxyacid dehydrogenase [Enterococcus sp.]